ncbi:hypothetical protein [Dongia sp.]|uniref:hypothetical protein n=1 Tax=Dongia sp. TaxID=1977262 RepID=UPI0035B303F6
MSVPGTIDGVRDSLAIGREALSGALLVWRRVPALLDLVALSDAKLRLGFDGDPLTAEARFEADEYLKRVRRLRAAFRADEAINLAFKRALAECGLAPSDCYWDPMQLRVVPSRPTHQGRRIMPLPAHRDNWGSNIPQQINWWSPLYPLSEGRSILFYPAYFDRPVANSSAEWDFETLKRLMNEGKAEQYPVLPVLTETLPAEAAQSVVIEPGDMLAFSGQHLHGSIATDTTATRFSVESRTVSLGHVASGLAAPNVDGRAPRVVPDWFEHVVSGERLRL